MNELIELSFIGHPIRMMRDGDNIWFVAKDIAEELGIVWNGADTLASIKQEWKGVRKFHTPGGMQDMLVLNETALYKFAFKSTKDTAEQFTDWIADEVLPSIRKTGTYSVKQLTAAEHYLAQAQILVEQERRTKEAERLALENSLYIQKQNIKIEEIECKNTLALNTAETALRTSQSNLGCCSVMGWAARCGQQIGYKEAAKHGKSLTKTCKGLGIVIEKIADPRWGYANTYPEHLLRDEFPDWKPRVS